MLIRKAISYDKIAIVATQMMESMINNTVPTRAEVFDVANAVTSGVDAIMLSAETAIGHYPVEVIQEASRICEIAEKTNTKTFMENYPIDINGLTGCLSLINLEVKNISIFAETAAGT